MAQTQVLIAGAGPTGLVLAINLVRRGIRVRLIDQAGGPGRASRAMAVQARTLEFYDQLGFADEVVRAGIQIETGRLHRGGREVAEIPFHEMGRGLSPFPFLLSYPQDDHEALLGRKVRELGVEIEWNTKLMALEQNESGVTATLKRNGARETVTADYLGGCDGAHSQVRQSLRLDFPGGMYSQLFYVADVKVSGALKAGALNAFLGENRFFLLLPVRSSGMERLIGIVPNQSPDAKDVSFEDVREEAERETGVRIEKVNWFSTYRVHHRVAAAFRVGRCFLAGDAGHIHSPAGGQGMNTGIGDAVNLAWKLAAVLKEEMDESLLDTYNSERTAFARRLVTTTDQAFNFVVNPKLEGRVVRGWILPTLAPRLARFAFVRRSFFKLISQIRLNYHGSFLSHGEVGAIRGGDRLPWVPSPGGDNFAALKSLDWQIHVYGKAIDQLRDFAIAVQEFPFTREAAKAGLRENALYLVRPDGYISLAQPTQDLGALATHLRRCGWLRVQGSGAPPHGFVELLNLRPTV